MTGYSDATIWLIILTVALGTYGLRWSFLGAFGSRPMPLWAQRLLRYTAVGVLPAIVAPLVVWPAATQGQPDPARMLAATVAVAVGVATRNVLAAILGGMATLYTALYLMT
ncbi:AzlD domain-containing protein [Paracoccus sp. P2]|uniref:AzlD domain-containing protein n=1 Tax=Paracoccus pantotrophus TaxID=82367 RepID=A0A1I5HMK0_PARPN|nr:AzlD domain-containing protein [Paracoccus pantotrophus]MDF3854736.1 AzlD domain-containing protein [Paracoccus pantotrophus]QFG38254.1 AzlD domain-containing protein [Paracoccus pantotrophus]QLH15796.1 AzlD domain-containing protein [Paracoccus pantotrophus]RDD94651.1 AzlD domain-containing protein [Paracoccus pantotrophus]RKS51235.1 branched-subunit amino acid transport protein [Paracoccus pantotrophus]